MSTTQDLFRKHFGQDVGMVNTNHPNVEGFFRELNAVCRLEDFDNELRALVSEFVKRNNLDADTSDENLDINKTLFNFFLFANARINPPEPTVL